MVLFCLFRSKKITRHVTYLILIPRVCSFRKYFRINLKSGRFRVMGVVLVGYRNHKIAFFTILVKLTFTAIFCNFLVILMPDLNF